jgi:hypothetical protein
MERNERSEDNPDLWLLSAFSAISAVNPLE